MPLQQFLAAHTVREINELLAFLALRQRELVQQRQQNQQRQQPGGFKRGFRRR